LRSSSPILNAYVAPTGCRKFRGHVFRGLICSLQILRTWAGVIGVFSGSGFKLAGFQVRLSQGGYRTRTMDDLDRRRRVAHCDFAALQGSKEVLARKALQLHT